MATSTAQRVGIWVIAGTLFLGTIGSFVAISLQNDNDATQQSRLNDLMAEYQAQQAEYNAKVEAQTAELSAQYFDMVNAYANRPAAYDAASVTELKTDDLKVGDGEELTAESTFTAYYIGWNPSGKVFDQSISEGALLAPIEAAPLGVIEGWTKGAAGMRVGGIRELTIPADFAYGDTDRGEDIPANTPLKFIMFVIPTPEKIEQPQPSEELLRLYGQSQQ